MFMVPELRGKADLTKYRKASAEVFNIVCGYDPSIIVERASIDEAFLDLTNYVALQSLDSVDTEQLSDIYVSGFEDSDNPIKDYVQRIREDEQELGSEETRNDINLLIAAKAVNDIRLAIKRETQFSCSAGVSHNKVLSKLGCGLKKPNGQSIVPRCGVRALYDKTQIKKVRNLGGKFGREIREKLNIETMGELADLSRSTLESAFGMKSAESLFDLAQGIDDEVVSDRQLLKSIGAGKNFPKSLATLEEVKHWAQLLSEELVERLVQENQENKRIAKNVVVGVRFKNKTDHFSKTVHIIEYDVGRICADIDKNVLQKLRITNSTNKIEPIINMSLSASKFVDCDSLDVVNKSAKMKSYFSVIDKPGASCSSEFVDQSISTSKVMTTHVIAVDDSSDEAVMTESRKRPLPVIAIENNKVKVVSMMTLTELYHQKEARGESLGFFARKITELMQNTQ